MAGKNHVSVQIEGWEELEAKLREVAATINTGELLENALMEGAEIVRSAIAAQAPVRTGQLRDSIEISKKGREKYSVRIGPSGQGFYGRYLEYGTSKMAARPFVRPAFDGSRGAAEKAISDAIWSKVQEVAGGS